MTDTTINWGLLYYGESFNTKGLAQAPQDMLVISYADYADPNTARSERPWQAEDIANIQAHGKEVFGYINLAEYSSYYEEWQDAWNNASTRAPWLIEAETDITYKVDFTHLEFQDIVKNRVSTLIDSGFDGALLDDALEYYFRVPDGLSGQAYDDAAAIQAVNMMQFILDIRTLSDEAVLQRDGELHEANRFELIINGAPFIGLDALNTDLSDVQRQAIQNLHDDYLSAIDYQLVENFITLFPQFIPTVIDIYHDSNVSLLSIDTDQSTFEQKTQTIEAALEAGFSPYVSENVEYNILSDPYFKYIELDTAPNDAQSTPETIIENDTVTIIPSREINSEVVAEPDVNHEVPVDVEETTSATDSVEHKLLPDVPNVTATQHINVIHGDDHANSIIGGEGDDVIYGLAGQDTLIGGRGNDTIHAGEEASWLIGGAGHDTLYGGGGDDVIIGKDGVNILHGGAGDDIFLFEKTYHNMLTIHEADIITDFSFGEDVLDVSQLGFNGFSQTIDDNVHLLHAEYNALSDLTYIINYEQNFGFALSGNVIDNVSDADFIFS